MGNKVARFLIHLLIRIVARVHVTGMENIPASGAYVAASNHIGRLEAALVYDLLDRRDIVMLAAEKYREVAIFRWLAKQLNAIFIDRYNADLVATRAALKRLKEGWVLVMAPEGTRSPDGALQEGWPGASYLAVRAGVPIIPVAVLGTADAEVMANLRRLRRTQVEVRVGAPFRLPPLDGRDREAQLKGFTDEIMLHIAALLPAERRGVYRDHPGLPALLEQELSQRNMV